ncbi:MAG: AAA family ATPase, partial [Dehalococcoidia bacterium]|nr:AAA family ATPase [Dehalococcoidia bacterium]
IKEKGELESRKLFSEKKDEIIKYLQQLKLAQKYKQCYEETEFKGITIKGKGIIKKALTPQLRASLEEEAKELGVEHLPIRLVPSGEEGQTLHKIDINTLQPLKRISLSEILSEGEHCVVGLAGFLAELQVAGHECPIVLDDPVCSLDHKYMRRIAKRLTKEAEKRQVIIFTHDIAFLLELKENAARSQKTPFTAQTIFRQGIVGKRQSGLPWHSMDVKDRLKYLRGELSKIKDFYPRNIPEYNKKAANIYALLRETWEAFVEERLLFRTIERHGTAVKTEQLRYVTVQDDDYTKIYFSMQKCSTWMTGHDKSKALSEDRPALEEITQDIEELAEYSNRIGTRNDELRKKREEMLKPKEAEIG